MFCQVVRFVPCCIHDVHAMLTVPVQTVFLFYISMDLPFQVLALTSPFLGGGRGKP